MTRPAVYKYFISQLKSIYTENEAAAIAKNYFEATYAYKLTDQATVPFTGEELEKINTDLACLLDYKPLQYVLNEAWFYNLKFFVNENVLIPRPETEELVEVVIKALNHYPAAGVRVLDIGTGSGCIPVTIKKHLPNVDCTALDISSKALEVAVANAKNHNVSITFLQLDFLDEENREQLGQYDIIVSNPPYISVTEKEKLERNVTGWEPHSALFAPGMDPLIFYKEIAEFAYTHVKPGGKIFVEAHRDYALQTLECFTQFFADCRLIKDMSGSDRIVTATNQIIPV